MQQENLITFVKTFVETQEISDVIKRITTLISLEVDIESNIQRGTDIHITNNTTHKYLLGKPALLQKAKSNLNISQKKMDYYSNRYVETCAYIDEGKNLIKDIKASIIATYDVIKAIDSKISNAENNGKIKHEIMLKEFKFSAVKQYNDTLNCLSLAKIELAKLKDELNAISNKYTNAAEDVKKAKHIYELHHSASCPNLLASFNTNNKSQINHNDTYIKSTLPINTPSITYRNERTSLESAFVRTFMECLGLTKKQMLNIDELEFKSGNTFRKSLPEYAYIAGKKNHKETDYYYVGACASIGIEMLRINGMLKDISNIMELEHAPDSQDMYQVVHCEEIQYNVLFRELICTLLNCNRIQKENGLYKISWNNLIQIFKLCKIFAN